MKLFTKEEIASIEAAIAHAESDTSAEIVPVIASASDSYDRAEGLFAFLFSLITLAAHWISIHMVASIGGSWKEPNQAALSLPSLVGVLVVSYALGIALASRLSFLKLPFISAKAIRAAVERRARESFQRFRIRKTDNATGILIYVSLYEHHVRFSATTQLRRDCRKQTGMQSETRFSLDSNRESRPKGLPRE